MTYIDIGNTLIKLHHNNETKIITRKELFDLFSNKAESYLVCSVVPELTNIITKDYPHVNLVTNKSYPYLFKFQNHEVYSRGTDRAVAIYAALQIYGNNVIVVDAGTALTIDAISELKYQEGFIFPGFNTMKASLFLKAPHLGADLQNTNKHSTGYQINYGSIYGFIGTINGLCKQCIKTSKKEPLILFTGGIITYLETILGYENFKNLFDFDFIYDDNLLFDGLKLYGENILPQLKKKDLS